MSDRALGLAMMGDDVFFAAIEAADRGTYGISCPCGCYHVARIAAGTDNARCPECGSARGSCESPALGSGPASVQNQGDDGGEPVLASLYFGEPADGVLRALAAKGR